MPVRSRLWALRHDRPRFVALALGVLGFLLAWPLVDWALRAGGAAVPFEFYDWGAITGGVARWYRGEPIYVEGDWGYHGSYLYPPVYLLVVAPFLELQGVQALDAIPFAEGTFEAAAMLWGAVTVGTLWAGLLLAAGEYGLEPDWLDRGLLLWALLGFQPLLYSVKMGQVAAFQGGLLALALVGLERGREPGADGRLSRLASGAATAVGSLVKLFYATAGAHLLENRQRFLGALGAGVALLLVSLGVFGVEAHRTYVDVLLWGKGWGTDPNPPWLWHAGYYKPLYALANFWPPLAVLARVAGLLAVVALAVGATGPGAARRTFALGLAGVPVFAPQAYTFDFVAVLPAVVVLLTVEFRRGPAGRPWLPVLAVWLMAVQAYGLKLVVRYLPDSFPLGELLVQATPVLQPGMWGTFAVLGLAAYRTAELVPWLPPSPATAGAAGDAPAAATRRPD